MIKEISAGSILSIKLLPGSATDQIAGIENNELKIKIRAVAEKGNANEALIKFLSKNFKRPLSSLKLISGFKNRHKKILFEGMQAGQLGERINALVKP